MIVHVQETETSFISFPKAKWLELCNIRASEMFFITTKQECENRRELSALIILILILILSEFERITQPPKVN